MALLRRFFSLQFPSKSKTLSLNHSSSSLKYAKERFSSRQVRYERNNILRANRRNAELERAARKRELVIDLEAVRTEEQDDWHRKKCRKELANHFGIFKDVHGQQFMSTVDMKIVYKESNTVYNGNILAAHKLVSPPNVSLPPPPSGTQWTLALTSPDNHLLYNEKELLLWLMVNIGTEDLSSGRTIVSYLPPVPPQGTGLHRYVFTLYLQTELDINTSFNGEDWLEERTFSSKEFILEHRLNPVGLKYFQCQWDSSVHDTFQNKLCYPEPVYHLEV